MRPCVCWGWRPRPGLGGGAFAPSMPPIANRGRNFSDHHPKEGFVGLAGIFLSLILLMYLAYRGINVLILAPLLAMLAVLMSGGLPVLAT